MTALLLGWVLASTAQAQDLSAGGDAFEQGHLDGAISAWLDASAPRSAAIDYNLGVAYYRQGDLPRAIAAWRTAALLRPRSADIAHNLAVARSKLPAAPDPVGRPVGWQAWLSVGELMALALVGLAGGSVSVWRRRALGPTAWAVPAASGALGTLAMGLAIWGAQAVGAHPTAVVVDAQAVLRDAAAVQAAEVGTLPLGSEVRVDRALGDFLLVHTADGVGGWIPRQHAVLVDPRLDALRPSAHALPPG